MEQDKTTEAPTAPTPVASAPVAPTPMTNDKPKSGKGLKIATAIACIVAACGIGFGVYGVLQNSEKDNQISNLKTQINELEIAETKNNTEQTIIEPVVTDNDDTLFATTVSTNIKNLGGSTYGFKSINLGNGTIYAYIDSNCDLILEKNGKTTIASNVIFADFLWEGNGGAPSLYFVRDDGTVGVVKNITDNATQTAEEIPVMKKAIAVKNITTQGGHKVIIVDVDGNFIDL